MLIALVALLTGCTPTPASIKLEGEPTVKVHSTDPLPLEKAEVLDASGAALADQHPTWTVTPENVAKLDGENLVPLANGEATVTATLGDLKAEYKVTVALPDKVVINGYTPGDAWTVGETKALTGGVFSGEAAIEGLPVTWASDNAAVLTVNEKGEATAAAEGAAKLTVSHGALATTVDVTIGAAAPATADAAAPQ